MLDAPILPPPAIELVLIAAPVPLIAEVTTATYDIKSRIASIKINNAFPLASKIKKYHGPYVTLIYDSHIVDIAACPVIRVPIANIKRDFPNILKDTVTLHISGIRQDLADKIEAVKCLKIDTPTVRSIVD